MDEIKEDLFSELLVFDRLEIGPVKLEPRRLVTPYRLHWGGKTEHTELIYRYEEDVFDPLEPESQNMAGMIAAQVALNYGLFCRSIVFHGSYDSVDRRFIRDMAENTAREIYVKKFIEHNPFLTDRFAHMTPERKAGFLQAKIEFQRYAAQPKLKWRLWPTEKQRHCILSSGGKDSLLTYGLLKEMDREVHPIFINESGRHWFTALNAYRYFQERVPNTARVWTNSDRVFSWMLRRMSFIRKNYTGIRSDEYPIRLWTVAVFIFGVLPLLKRRGIGRLLIGDEYDTTVRKVSYGITHYDGLYDQSIYFDQTLSRYFMKKGWSVSQFSILRPLSELLIEKILTERYPELLDQQTSCHMTHKEEERVYPCGKCEKCRRIVSMLTALDADPKRCGYNASQIRACLEDFAKKGISQEAAGFQHLGYLLTQKGVIADLKHDSVRFQERPEILKLRFNSKVSPPNAIPNDLRRPLWTLLLKHADGALIESNRKWHGFDLLNDPAANQTFSFELDTRSIAKKKENESALKGSSASQSYLWGELSWPEAEDYLRQTDIALLPVGAIEQHGPHLPLDTDTFDAEYLSRSVAEACSDPKPLVLPVIAYGISYHHDDFAGTMSISNDTLSRLVYDVGVSAARNGIRKFVIINGHGGNIAALNYAAQMINRDTRIFVCVDTGDTSDVDVDKIIETPNDVHAGEMETSTALAVRPHLVKMNRAAASIPAFSSTYLNFTSKRGVSWHAFTNKISASGVMGDPTKASAKKGIQIWEMMIAHLVDLVEDLKRMTLEEIHKGNE
jgi:creatinine amidohydrolase/Fe(II)-dependent formamide hydrolase-like protein/7-cyano-7-deazaguanine synthase in queuosine biosynthesis